ncbi:MAG: hypothetical protein AAFQ80_15965 [Cyanobacteria bacterium J06621_8]
MLPRWFNKPDRNLDPEFRRENDSLNFAVHVNIFAATNSGLWFFHNIYGMNFPRLPWITGIWLGLLVLHLIYIKAIADYSSINT